MVQLRFNVRFGLCSLCSGLGGWLRVGSQGADRRHGAAPRFGPAKKQKTIEKASEPTSKQQLQQEDIFSQVLCTFIVPAGSCKFMHEHHKPAEAIVLL